VESNLRDQKESLDKPLSEKPQDQGTGQPHDTEIKDLIQLRQTNPSNPIIGYLNINSLRHKITELRDILNKAQIDIICVDETKLDSSFPDSQFKIDNYQFPSHRRDRNSKGGGKMVFIKQGLIAKRLPDLETNI